MKECPRCGRTYTDPQLNFCLEDGELLMQAVPHSSSVDDSPPTVMLNDPRSTNPVGWPASTQAPPVQYQQPQMWGAMQPPPYILKPITTLAVISMILGISSMTIGWCCYLGVLLAPASAICGFIALSQIKNDPQRYGGRGMALAGIITSAVYIVLLVLLFIIVGASSFIPH